MVTTPEFQTLPPKTEDFTTGLSISYPSSNATFWFTVYPTDGGIKFLNLDVLKPASPYTYSATGFPPMVITVDNELKTLTYSQQAATTSIPVSISSSASNAPSSAAASNAPSSAAASNAPSSAAASNQPTSIGPSQTGSRPTNTTGSQSTKPTNSSDGLSGGAVAGVAIGCLIVGAVIAGLLVWFCLGKRRKTQHARDSEASTLALMPREKGPIAKAISLEGGSPITASLDNALPQPLEDAAISGEISKISNLIKNHVQSFYHTGRGSPGLLDFDDIQALGHDLPLSTGTLSTLLTNSATREMALRFCIAWVVISRMQPLKELNTNLLPPEVSQCFQAMSFVDRGSKVHALLMARWRAITAELMQSAYVRNPFAPSDSRNANIQAATSILNSVLQPFADSRMDNQQRKQNLEEILKRSALFAFTLFSQPSSWDFDWQDKSEVKSGNLCVFPALVQVTDETGELVRPPRAFNEAVVRRLDE